MTPDDLDKFFEERFSEIVAYLQFLHQVEEAARSGPPRIQGAGTVITAPQQKILYSSVYLQLYNLGEATVSRCIGLVTDAAAEDGRWRPDDLNEAMRNEWVRSSASTHEVLTPENRLLRAVATCNLIMAQLPIPDTWAIQSGGGGNWDDDAIERMSKRVGCNLRISRKVKAAAKRQVRDGLGALKLVKKLRNSLAHGSISFVECGDEVTVSELQQLAETVANYLREAVGCFTSYVVLFEFLRPDRKPQQEAS